MGNKAQFWIEDGNLLKYWGDGGDLIIPDEVTGIGDYAFKRFNDLTSLTIPESVTYIDHMAFAFLSTTILVCYTWYAVSCFNSSQFKSLVYLGGPVYDLDMSIRESAARGFIYALHQDRAEIGQWRDDYVEYIRDHNSEFMEDARNERYVLLILIHERLLNEEAARQLLDHYDAKDDTEAKAALLQYIHANFESGGFGDLSF